MTTFLDSVVSDANNLIMDTQNGVAETGDYTPDGAEEAIEGITVVMNRNNYASDYNTSGEDWVKTAIVYILRSDVDQPERKGLLVLSDGNWKILDVTSQNIAGTTCTLKLLQKKTAGHLKR